MNIPQDLLYTDSHEWIRAEGSAGTIGITDYAQQALSDITFVELPVVGKTFAKGDEIAAIESCKAAAGLNAPVGGKVTAVNTALEDDPGLVNSDPYGSGWIVKIAIADPGELAALLKPADYAPLAEQEES